jgi:hypothetical protein
LRDADDWEAEGIGMQTDDPEADEGEVSGTFPALVAERSADMSAATLQTQPLTAFDRCDRCGAQAYLRVELAGGGELLFCAHHSREHGEKLRSIAVGFHDETGKLAPRRSVAQA